MANPNGPGCTLPRSFAKMPMPRPHPEILVSLVWGRAARGDSL